MLRDLWYYLGYNKHLRFMWRAAKYILPPAFIIIWTQAGFLTALWAAPLLVLLVVGLSQLGVVPLGGPVLCWWLASVYAFPWFFRLAQISPELTGEDVAPIWQILFDLDDVPLKTTVLVACMVLSVRFTFFSCRSVLRNLYYVGLLSVLFITGKPLVLNEGLIRTDLAALEGQ